MRIPAFAAVLALTATILTGCSVAAESIDGTTSVGGDAGYSSEVGAPIADAGGKVASDQSVITTATAFLTDDDPVAVSHEIESLVSAAGGRIDGRNVSSDQEGNTTWVSLTVRVPADKLDGFLSGLDEVATVENLGQYSQDVTLIVTDYEARISSLQAAIERLQQLLRGANKTSDLIEIETALADRQSQLESLQGEMRYYADQIDMSTVQVDIGLPASATDPVPDDFWSGIVAGWNGILAFFGGIIIVIGVLIPWIPLVAIVAAGVWWLVRRRAAKAAARPARTARKQAATRTTAKR